MNITVMKTLLRRETWEHRGLIWAPLITAAVIVLTALLSTSFTGSVQINIDGKSGKFLPPWRLTCHTSDNFSRCGWAR